MSQGYHMYNWALAKRLTRMLRTDLFDEYGYVQERPVDRRKIDCYTMEAIRRADNDSEAVFTPEV